MRVRDTYHFEKRGPGEKRSFHETKEERNEKRASEIVRDAGCGATDIQTLANIGGKQMRPT